jgi:hypothetical protein
MMVRCENPQVEEEKEEKKKKKKKEKKKTEVPNRLVDLHRFLCASLPYETDQAYSPHSSVGQMGQNEIETVLKQLNEKWKSVTFTVSELAVLRKKNEKMVKVQTIKLRE